MKRPLTRLATVLPAAAVLLAAPTALAAGGSEFEFTQHGFYILDFLIFVGLLVYFVRKPARQYLHDRHEAVRREMDEAMRLKREAEEQLQRFEQRLERLDEEIEELRQSFREDGQRQHERIVADAEASAERLREHAQRDIQREASQLRLDLQHELAGRAMERAEALVRERLDDEQQQALVRDFIGELEARQQLASPSQ